MKELTEKQQSFLNHLVETGGNAKKSAELAGYTAGHYQVVKALKTEIIDLADNILAKSAPQAPLKLLQVMNTETPIPQANSRLQSAQSILDRIGLSKTELLDVTHKADTGLFILPAKKETVVDGEYMEASSS